LRLTLTPKRTLIVSWVVKRRDEYLADFARAGPRVTGRLLGEAAKCLRVQAVEVERPCAEAAADEEATAIAAQEALVVGGVVLRRLVASAGGRAVGWVGKQRQLRAPSPDQTMSQGVKMLN
jgi:hypothetical protein